MMNEKILIISYHFPPFPGVGGRRWAKFAKYLKLFGYDPYILSVTRNVDIGEITPWDNDIKLYEKNIYTLYKDESKPYYKKKLPYNIIEKLFWKLSLVYNNIIDYNKKGLFSDISEPYKKDILHKAIELIKKENINKIIVSVGPFRYGHELRKLKYIFPNKYIFLDVRDFWEDWMFNYTEVDRDYEGKIEKETFEVYDMIFSPAEQIINRYKKKYPSLKSKFHHLTHAYDNDDYPKDISITKNEIKEEIKIIYAGTLYEGMENFINRLVDFLIKLSYKKKIFFDIYGNNHGGYFKNKLHNNNIVISFNTTISSKMMMEKIKNESDFVLYIRSNKQYDKHFFSTKFYDVIKLEKPLLFVGDKGDVSNFIDENQLGFNLKEHNSQEVLNKILNINDFIYAPNFDKQKYEFKEVTKKLIKKLEQFNNYSLD